MNSKNIYNTIKRISYQIYENNYEEKDLVLAGVKENGLVLAKRIKKELEIISDLNIILISLKVDKKDPTSEVIMSNSSFVYEKKSVIVIDDVLNTGSTLIYAVKKFLYFKVKKIQTAVLVNRNHKNFPIKGDFKGLSLSTSTKENIDVRFGNEEGVYLS